VCCDKVSLQGGVDLTPAKSTPLAVDWRVTAPPALSWGGRVSPDGGCKLEPPRVEKGGSLLTHLREAEHRQATPSSFWRGCNCALHSSEATRSPQVCSFHRRNPSGFHSSSASQTAFREEAKRDFAKQCYASQWVLPLHRNVCRARLRVSTRPASAVSRLRSREADLRATTVAPAAFTRRGRPPRGFQ